MGIILAFASAISEAYRQKLLTFTNNVLAQGITENRPPIFYFTGINFKILDGIKKLQLDYDRRYYGNYLKSS